MGPRAALCFACHVVLSSSSLSLTPTPKNGQPWVPFVSMGKALSLSELRNRQALCVQSRLPWEWTWYSQYSGLVLTPLHKLGHQSPPTQPFTHACSPGEAEALASLAFHPSTGFPLSRHYCTHAVTKKSRGNTPDGPRTLPRSPQAPLVPAGPSAAG